MLGDWCNKGMKTDRMCSAICEKAALNYTCNQQSFEARENVNNFKWILEESKSETFSWALHAFRKNR